MKVLDKLSSLSVTQVRVVGLVGVVLVGFIDEVTGTAISFTVLYLIPIVLVSWYDGKAAGIVASAVALGFNFISDFDYEAGFDTVVIIWNTVSRFLIFAAVVWMLDALREMQRARLQAEIDRYTRIVETTIEGILVLDARGYVKYSNVRAAQLLGWSTQELHGKHFTELVTHGVSRMQVGLMASGTDVSEMGPAEVQFTRSDGNPLWAIVNCGSFPEASNDGGVVLLVNDISARKHAEDELRRQYVRISAMQRLASVLVGSMNMKWRLESALHTVLDVTGFDAGAIYLASKELHELTLQHHEGLLPGSVEAVQTWREGYGVTGEVWRTGVAQFLDDATLSDAMDTTVRDHERIRAFASIPLVASGTVVGVLNILRREPHAFSDDERSMLQTFGGQMGVALENAQLFEAARTGENKVRQLSINLVRIQEEERKKFARELHDGLAQLLTMLRVNAELALECLGGSDEEAGSRIREVISLVGEAEHEAKQISYDLRPAILDDFGLKAAIQAHAVNFERRTRVAVELHLPASDIRFESIIETTVYRIVQELLSNVAKHANATRATIQLLARHRVLALTVSDNGRGFDVHQTLAQSSNGLHNGLRNMRERTESLKGMFHVESSPGRGAEFAIEIPCTLAEMQREEQETV